MTPMEIKERSLIFFLFLDTTKKDAGISNFSCIFQLLNFCLLCAEVVVEDVLGSNSKRVEEVVH